MPKAAAGARTQVTYSTAMLTDEQVCQLLYLDGPELEELVTQGDLVRVAYKEDELRIRFSDIVGMLDGPEWEERKRRRGG